MKHNCKNCGAPHEPILCSYCKSPSEQPSSQDMVAIDDLLHRRPGGIIRQGCQYGNDYQSQHQNQQQLANQYQLNAMQSCLGGIFGYAGLL